MVQKAKDAWREINAPPYSQRIRHDFGHRVWRVEFAKAFAGGFTQFDLVDIPRLRNHNAIVRNNHMHDAYMRFGLYDSPGAMIEGNTFERGFLMVVGEAGDGWLEGPPAVNDVMVKANKFVDCFSAGPAIGVDSATSTNIRLVGNTCENNGSAVPCQQRLKHDDDARQAASTPIQLHPKNKHYFEFRGQPTLLIGGGEHYGAVLNSDFDFSTYLHAVAAQGGNVVRTWSGSYCEPPNAFGIKRNTLAPAEGKLLAPWARSTSHGYIGGGNKFDLSQWSAPYFTRLKAFMSLASDLGIVVNFALFSREYNPEIWARSPLNGDANINGVGVGLSHTQVYGNNSALLAAQLELTSKLVRELAGFDNVIFEVVNEPYVNVADAWQAQIAAAIKAEHTEHLVCQNIANKFKLVSAATLDPNVDVIQFHYAVPNASLANYGLQRAIGYDETGFKGSEPTPYRRAAWAWMLAGGSTFNNLDYSFSVGHENGTDAANTAPGCTHPEIRRQLAELHSFMRRIDFLKMAPMMEKLNVIGTGRLAVAPQALALANNAAVVVGVPHYAMWMAISNTTGWVGLSASSEGHQHWVLCCVNPLDGTRVNSTVTALGDQVSAKCDPSWTEAAMVLVPVSAAEVVGGSLVSHAEVVRQHILQELVPSRPIDNVDREVAVIVPALQNGTWADIDYTGSARSWWFAAEHLRRCLLLASAFSSNHSKHHASTHVHAVADQAFEWWLRADPQNQVWPHATNQPSHSPINQSSNDPLLDTYHGCLVVVQWWWMQIGIPRIMCKYLLMMPSPRLYAMALPLLERTPLHTAMGWTGCNRVWGASVHVLRGAIELNATRLGAAFSIAHSTLKWAPQSTDGIQLDGSFHQHGPQLYSGWGYGAIYSTNMLVLDSYLLRGSMSHNPSI